MKSPKLDQEYLDKRNEFVERYKLDLYKPNYDEADFIDILRHLEEAGGFSDVYFNTGERVRLKAGGYHFPIMDRELEREEVVRLVKLIAGESAIALLNSGRDNDPSWYVPRTDKSIDVYRYRVNLTKGLNEEGEGYHATLRSLKQEIPSLEFVGLSEELAWLMMPRQGLGLFCGTTGSGKSTTLASLIDFHLQHGVDKHILTYESPIEYVFKTKHLDFNSIVQTEIGDIGGYLKTMAAGVRNSLRRNADVVLIGETRDRETGDAALQAANTGQFCMTTLHCNSVSETIERFMSFYSDAATRKQQMIVFFKQIKWIICQFLVKGIKRPLLPVREYIFFSEQDRDDLINYEGSDVAGLVKTIISKSNSGQLMADHAKQLYDAGEIARADYLYVMSGVS